MVVGYPAYFIKDNLAGYRVIFPDLDELETQGDSFEEAYRMAMESLELWIFSSYAMGNQLRYSSRLESLDREDYNTSICYVYVDVVEYTNELVDVEVEIPKWLYDKAIENNIELSKTLEEALKRKAVYGG